MRLTSQLLLGLLCVVAAVGAWRSPHSYAAQDRVYISSPANRAFPAGSDDLGRDRAVRTAMAFLLGLSGACCASAVASGCSLLLGAGAAFCPGWVGRGLMYGSDLFLTLPWIFLLMIVRASLPLALPPWKSGALTYLLLAVLGVPAFLRLHYRRAVAMRKTDWVSHAHAAGLRNQQIARQFLPHLGPMFWIQFLLYVPVCIAAEANLGALGLGIAEPVPSWGNMLGSLQSTALLGGSYLVYLPLLVLVLVLVLLELIVFGARHEV